MASLWATPYPARLLPLLPCPVPGSVLSHLLMGLEPLTNYTCEVTANTSAGGGNSSNADTERMDEDGKDFLNEKC